MSQPGIFSLGRSAALVLALSLADALAPSPEPILLEGEPGSGKNHLARYIHERSRPGHPFVYQQLPAMADELQRSTLFGHIIGAFTGAVRESRGLLSEAHRGTLFLDELADSTPGVQALLLRVTESGTFRRVGESKDTHVSVRILAATNADLNRLIANGLFRRDLRDRFGPNVIWMPPLRDRADEIMPSFVQFLSEVIARHPRTPGLAAPVLAPDTVALLRACSWPGNFRQLRQEADHAFHTLREGLVLLPEHLSRDVEADGEAKLTDRPLATVKLEVLRRRLARAVRAGGTQSIAVVADRLRVSRRRVFQILAQPRLTIEQLPRELGGEAISRA